MACSYLLYYAGMAEDKVTEQIGLATSTDGIRFERLPPDGLVLRRDAVPWRDLRVCNPTVLPAAGGFVMFYQGISESLQVSIGRATSPDGRTWACDREPSLPWEQMRALVGVRKPARRTAVFEPSVLLEDGRFRMWFLYLGAGHESHSLFYAESRTGESWEIRPEPLLTGRRFGLCLLHYPQVLRTGNRYRLYFTLRSLRSGVDAIHRMQSADGLSWGGLETVLARWELPVARSRPGLAGKVAGRLVRPVNRLLERGPYRDVELGYAHPHVVERENDALLFWQSSSRGPRGRVMRIGVSTLTARGAVAPRRVLEPSDEPGRWDSFFVADPYVVPVRGELTSG